MVTIATIIYMESPRTELRAFRKQQKWSCQKLADAIGYSKTAIINIENGKRRPCLDVAVAIARLTAEFGVEIPVTAWANDSIPTSLPPDESTREGQECER